MPDGTARVPDRSSRRRVDAGNQVEQGRLAGAVRTDDAEDLILLDAEVEAADDIQTAEGLAEAIDL